MPHLWYVSIIMSEGAILQHLIHYEQNAKLYTTTQHYLKIKMKESLVWNVKANIC